MTVALSLSGVSTAIRGVAGNLLRHDSPAENSRYLIGLADRIDRDGVSELRELAAPAELAREREERADLVRELRHARLQLCHEREHFYRSSRDQEQRAAELEQIRRDSAVSIQDLARQIAVQDRELRDTRRGLVDATARAEFLSDENARLRAEAHKHVRAATAPAERTGCDPGSL